MENPYDLIAAQWYAQRRKRFPERRYLDRIIQNLSSGARILDLGCGTGDPIARYLLEHGFQVVGVDRSGKMLELAKQLVPKAALVHADMNEIDFKDQFAALIAWDSVFHTARKYHQTLFGKFYRWLKPNAWLLLSVGVSGGEHFTSEMFGHTFSYSGHPIEESVRLLERERFRIEQWEVDDPSSRGHVAIIGQKMDW